MVGLNLPGMSTSYLLEVTMFILALLIACVDIETGSVDTAAPTPSSVEEVVCGEDSNTVDAGIGYPLLMECNDAGCVPLEWYAIQEGFLDFRGCTPGNTVRIWRVR